jgi:hypothetical protein
MLTCSCDLTLGGLKYQVAVSESLCQKVTGAFKRLFKFHYESEEDMGQ